MGSFYCLRTYTNHLFQYSLSKDNDQVYKKLRELQSAQISPDMPMISSSTTLTSIFSEGSSGGVNNMGNPGVIHHLTDDSGSSAVLSAQIPGDFNDETWDFSDEDDLQTDLHTTIAETAVPQDDINTPNHSLNPVASVNPALENGPPLSSTLEQDTITHTHTATTPTNDGATHVHSTEESHDSELQPLPSEPINADEASIHGVDESQLVINPSGSQSAYRLDEESMHLQNDSVLASPVFPTPSTRSSSPLSYLSYIDSDDEDQDAAAIQHSEIHLDSSLPITHTSLDPDKSIEHDTPLAPINSSPTPEFLTQLSWDVSQLESSLEHSLDHPQTTQTTLDPNALIEHDSLSIISKPSLELLSISEPPTQAVQEMVESWQILIGEDEEAIEPPYLPPTDPATSDTYSDVNEGQ